MGTFSASVHSIGPSPAFTDDCPGVKRRVLIIGAGPTAMGALWRLSQLRSNKSIPETDIVVLEQEQGVGGLASTETDPKGFSWDLGVHVMGLSKYPHFVEAIGACVPEWRVVPRCAMVDLAHVFEQYPGPCSSSASSSSPSLSPLDCYVPYPVQNSVPYFPAPLKHRCLEELNQLQGMDPDPDNSDFARFSLCLFGPSLQHLFLRPYNEKVWTVGLAELGTRWLQGRVPRIDMTQLAHRCALSREQLVDEDREQQQRQAAFRYPANCRGIGEMWHNFAAQFPAGIFQMGQRVIGIDPEAKRVRSVKVNKKDGEEEEEEKVWPYDVLISTIPLTELGRLSGVAPDLGLKHSAVVLVGIGLHGGQSEFARRLSWAYYPRPEIIFYRCTVLSNFSPELVPSTSECNGDGEEAHWSVLCEISRRSDEEIPSDKGQREEIVDKAIEDLIRVGILHSSANVCSRWLKVLPYGYPIPTLDRDKVLAKCHQRLERHQIYSRGRFGGWRYEVSNQDHSFQCGLELIDRLFLGVRETLYTATE